MAARGICCSTNQSARCDSSYTISQFEGFTLINCNLSKNNTLNCKHYTTRDRLQSNGSDNLTVIIHIHNYLIIFFFMLDLHLILQLKLLVYIQKFILIYNQKILTKETKEFLLACFKKLLLFWRKHRCYVEYHRLAMEADVL